MPMVRETKEQNSATGSGLSATVSRGLKALFHYLGGVSQRSKLAMTIVQTDEGYFVVRDTGYGSSVSGPYKREKDAKGVRTRMIKQRG